MFSLFLNSKKHRWKKSYCVRELTLWASPCKPKGFRTFSNLLSKLKIQLPKHKWSKTHVRVELNFSFLICSRTDLQILLYYDVKTKEIRQIMNVMNVMLLWTESVSHPIIKLELHQTVTFNTFSQCLSIFCSKEQKEEEEEEEKSKSLRLTRYHPLVISVSTL